MATWQQEKAKEIAKNLFETYNKTFIEPLKQAMTQSIGNTDRQTLNLAAVTAKSLFEVYRANFANPLRTTIASIMAGAIGGSLLSNNGLLGGTSNSTSNTVNVYADIANTGLANTTAKGIGNAMNFSTNPKRIS